MTAAFDSSLGTTTMNEAQALRPSRLFIKAIQQSDLNLFQKLRLRVAYLVPSVRSAVDEYVDGVVEQEAQATGTDVSAMADGTIIKIILEHLPEIMALIELIIKLLG